ncbi:MAG: hypothetical protein ABI210_13930 [Abditibacteriaceae bacterium]
MNDLKHGHHTTHKHHSGERRERRSWLFWVFLVLAFVAMAFYILTGDLGGLRRNHQPQPVTTAIGK